MGGDLARIINLVASDTEADSAGFCFVGLVIAYDANICSFAVWGHLIAMDPAAGISSRSVFVPLEKAS